MKKEKKIDCHRNPKKLHRIPKGFYKQNSNAVLFGNESAFLIKSLNEYQMLTLKIRGHISGSQHNNCQPLFYSQLHEHVNVPQTAKKILLTSSVWGRLMGTGSVGPVVLGGTVRFHSLTGGNDSLLLRLESSMGLSSVSWRLTS